jgi:hypothetical protein
MKRKLALLLCLALFAFAIPARAADVFLLGFTGFDYEDPDQNDPDPDGANYLNVGDGYKAVGLITSFGTPLLPYVNQSANEYTFHIFDLSVIQHDWDAPNQFLSVTFASNGRVRYFEDSNSGGTTGTYGINPPNGTSPSTFTDGTLILGGRLDNYVLFYDYSSNMGGFSGEMVLDEGSDLVYISPPQRNGWLIGGQAGRPNTTIPTGYDNQISGEARIFGVTPARTKSWGAVKALYR